LILIVMQRAVVVRSLNLLYGDPLWRDHERVSGAG
jgi:hypothetical protein